jgi:hypothetical protein
LTLCGRLDLRALSPISAKPFDLTIRHLYR